MRPSRRLCRTLLSSAERLAQGSLPVAADAPCQGFSVSDGTAGWQTGEQHVALRRSSGQQPEEEEVVDGRALSLQSVFVCVCSAQLECLVM